MTAYRPLPEAPPKSPAGYFAATAMPNVYVSKHPNWVQRTFTPFPYVYLDYDNPKESIRTHIVAVALAVVPAFFGFAFATIGAMVLWLLLIFVGFTGVFHCTIETTDWEEK